MTDSRDQSNFTHRSSVPTNIYHQQYHQADDQLQPRSFSVSQTPFRAIPPPAAGPQGFQWRDDQDCLPTEFGALWQPQQQFRSRQEMYQPAKDINNLILDEAKDVQNRNSNNAPWTSLDFQQQAPQRFDIEQLRLHSLSAATGIPATRSQPGSFARDSGYRSFPPHKRSAPLDVIEQGITDELLSPSHIPVPQFTGNKSPRSVVSDSQLHNKKPRRPAVAKNTIRCTVPGCGKSELKNPSDLQKHLNQHDKPFLCTETGCERAEEGFGTSNDLERHRASVHHLQQRCGTTVGFICFACEQSRPTRKWWPRKDNFKSHIRRKHQDWKLEDLIELSRHDFRPPDARTEIRSASSCHDNLGDLFDHNATWNQPQSSPNANYLLSPHGNVGDILAGEGQWTNPTATQNFTDTIQLSTMRSASYAQGQLGASNMHFEMPPADIAAESAPLTTPVLRLTVPAQSMQSQELETLGWDRSIAGSQSQSGSSQIPSQSASGHKCSICDKVKQRACDLRKHEKRHTRPYGCTFPRCLKRFGSRNDWKRHEKVQHSLAEQWRCQLPAATGGACGKLFHKREEMSEHLDNRHGNDGYHHDSPIHWDAIDASHIGQERYQSYWCGFCNNLIPRKTSTQQYNVDPRFQHIGDHFDKDRMHIGDWIDLEENKQKRHISRPKPTMTDSSSEGNVLEAEGIASPSTFAHSGTTVLGRSTTDESGSHVQRRSYFRNGRANVDEDAEGESDYEYSHRNI